MCPYATPNKRDVSLTLPLEGRRSIQLSYGRVESLNILKQMESLWMDFELQCTDRSSFSKRLARHLDLKRDFRLTSG